MSVQVLISTMYQTDYSLLERMNIQTDAIVVNQCDDDKVERFVYNDHQIIWMSLKERGVGLSRNTALVRATGDIVVFADDDVVYNDGYENIIESAFNNQKNADALTFCLDVIGDKRKDKDEFGLHRLNLRNSLRYGTYRLACKRDALLKNRISFSLLFGGGAKFNSGEDNIFITDLIKKKCKIYATSVNIGTVAQNESTWFKGYDEKYFYDKGVLMSTIYKRFVYALTALLIIRHPEQYGSIGMKSAIKESFKGIRSGKKERL